MILKDLWQKHKKVFYDKYVMPHECKDNLAVQNEKKLLFVEPILCVFGFSMLIVTFLTSKSSTSNPFFLYIYYGGIFFTGLLTICITLFTINRPKINLKIKMIPTYIAVIFLYILINITYMTNNEVLTSFIIFACVSVIIPIYFNIEPLLFSPLIIISTIFMILRTSGIDNVTETTADIILFSVLIILLSLFKWKTIKADYLHSKQQDEYKDKMEKELNLASTVQSSFFNQKKTNFDGWSIEFYTKAMTGVSGDFIDIYSDENNLHGFGIFDVSGHGIASGLVTMLVKNIIDQEFYNGSKDDLKTVIDRINVRFSKEKGNIENYLTGILCRINEDSVDFVNAGHSMPVFLDAKTGKADYIIPKNNEKTFGAIGLKNVPNNFISHSVTFSSGDELILFTDGVTDSLNTSREAFGKERFIKSITRNAERSLTTQLKCITSDLSNFSFEMPQNDDITIIILKKK